jgi:molybdate transport system substrate-binding protein
LQAAGMFDQVFARSAYLATDSRNLNQALKTGDADLILNWRSTAFSAENRDKIDVIDLDAKIAQPDPLYLIQLNFTKHPDIARRIIDFAASPPGQAIFRKHGFVDNKMKADL